MSNTLERNELIVAYSAVQAAVEIVLNEQLCLDYTTDPVQLCWLDEAANTTYPRAILQWVMLNRSITMEARSFTGVMLATVCVPLKD